MNGSAARHHGGFTNDLANFKHRDMVPILDPTTDYIAFVRDAATISNYYGLIATDSTRYTAEMSRLSELKENDNPVIFLYKQK